MIRQLAVCGWWAAALASCAAPAEPEDHFLRRAEMTLERPAIGRMTYRQPDGSFTYCTATLVAPDDEPVASQYVLTAAHCVDYQTVAEAGSEFEFTVQDETGQPHRFPVAAFRSLSKYLGPTDFALLRLGEPVPGWLADPLPLASATPSYGQPITVYGYGCTDRDTRAGGGVKRRVHQSFWDPRLSSTCPGDSGGPWIHEASDTIVHIISGYYESDGERSRDVLGNVSLVHDDLRAQMLAWEQGEPDPPGCADGDTRACYTGPAGTLDVGRCAGGTQRCRGDGMWEWICQDQRLPLMGELGANAVDDDCDGNVDAEPWRGYDCSLYVQPDDCKARAPHCQYLTCGEMSACYSAALTEEEICSLHQARGLYPSIESATRVAVGTSITLTWQGVPTADSYLLSAEYRSHEAGAAWTPYASWWTEGPGKTIWPQLSAEFRWHVTACRQSECALRSGWALFDAP